MRTLVLAVLLACFVQLALGDMYMHNPRGSNNRHTGRGTNRANNNRMCNTQNNAKGGYVLGPAMYYYVGSVLDIEWTNQHGCGNDNLDCNIVIQYMCGDEVRDGATTQTIPDNEAEYNTKTTNDRIEFYRSNSDEDLANNEVFLYGMHESYQYFQDCKSRERNRGLFTADQNPGSSARSTRQNPGGGTSAFECQEERDYYPYWHPHPWKDIAILTDDTSRCDFYRSNSQNNRGYHYCTNNRYNNEAECLIESGTWERADSVGGGDVDCQPTQYSRDNHLGNGFGAVNNHYRWIIPDDPHEFCVLRLRYNISTTDYDGWNTYSDQNRELSPIKNDPYIYYGDHPDTGMVMNLSLAINTNQFGRTFQDRSHTFAIRSRSGFNSNNRVYNLNVKGKRGNIVQAYPAVEYDFHPTDLYVKENDKIHFQWTGGDDNPQGNDGEGVRGTDRSNIVQLTNRGDNSFDYEHGSLFDDDDRRYFAHLGQENCSSYEQLQEDYNNQDQRDRAPENCMKLNAASPYFDGGLLTMKRTGSFHFVSSRNNNFSNRSQKGGVHVGPFLPVWAIVLVVLAGLACCVAIPVSVVGFVARLLPDSKFAQGWRMISQIKRTDDSMDMDDVEPAESD